MKYRLMIILVLVNGLIAFGQRPNNPFEVSRDDTKPDPVILEDSINFSVKSESEVNPFVQKDGDGKTQVVDPTVTTDIDNPFEVDHVPIRRSSLRENSAVKRDVVNSPKEIKNDAERNLIKVPPTVKNSESNGLLVFVVSMISLILIAIVANTRRSLFQKIFRSFLNDNMMKLTYREENAGFNGAFIILYLLYFLNAATLIYLAIRHFQDGVTFNWWYLLVGIFLIYIVRHLSLWIFGTIFNATSQVIQYNFMIAVFNLLVGLILIPLNLVIAYTTASVGVAALYVAIAIILFILIIRYSKGFLLGLIGFSRSMFHFLLYLCAFEILPVLIFYKIFKII